MRADLTLTALHVASLLVWVGGALSAYLAARTESNDDATRREIATRIYKWVANPAFILAFLFGAIRLGMDWRHYFVVTHFMHAKLLFALLAIAAHHILGARIRKSATSQAFHSSITTIAAVTFGLSCLASVYIVVVRPF